MRIMIKDDKKYIYEDTYDDISNIRKKKHWTNRSFFLIKLKQIENFLFEKKKL